MKGETQYLMTMCPETYDRAFGIFRKRRYTVYAALYVLPHFIGVRSG
jgi:hypothetical protein